MQHDSINKNLLNFELLMKLHSIFDILYRSGLLIEKKNPIVRF